MEDVKVDVTEVQLDEQIDKEINAKMVADVEKLINPPELEGDGNPPPARAEEVKDGEVKAEQEADKLAPLGLPRRLSQAAKRNQLTDDEVLALGDNVVPVLTKLADRLDAVSAELGKEGQKRKQELAGVKKEPPKEVPTLKFDDATLEDNPALKEIQEKLNATSAELNALRMERETEIRGRQQQEVFQRDLKIDGFFDSVQEQYPEFGKTAELTKAELTNRVNVWETADNILIGAQIKGEKLTLEDALNQAFYQYEGKNPQKVVNKLLGEVKKREEQLTHRPTSKRAKEQPPSNKEQAVKAVEKLLNRGKSGWEK